LVLASIAWGQSSIDEKIKQEQNWLSNESLPPSVKAIVEQRIAKLQQAKTVESQIEAAQQYRDSHPDLSQEDKSKIDATVSQLKIQLTSLLSQAPTQPSQSGPQGDNQSKSSLSNAVAAGANNAKNTTEVKAAAVVSSQEQTQSATTVGCLSGSADDYELTDLGVGIQYKLQYKPTDPKDLPLLKAAVKDATGHNVQIIGILNESTKTIEVSQVGKDNGPCTFLQSQSLMAATGASPIKTFAKAGAATIVRTREEGRDPSGVYPTVAHRLALLTVFGAIDPADVSSVSGDSLDLLQRQVNVKTETARTDKQLTAPASNSGSTSPVQSPGLPLLLGVALANGAIQQQNTGAGLTLSTSPYSIAAAVNGGDTDQNYKNYAVYQRLGVSATFDVQGQTNPDPTQLSRRQLEDWSARVRLTPDRSTRSQGFAAKLDKRKDIINGLGAEGAAVDNLLYLLRHNQKILQAFNTFAAGDWLAKLLANNTSTSADKLEPILEEELIAHLQTDFVPQVAGQPFLDSQELRTPLQDLVTAQKSRLKAAKDFEDLATSYSQQFEATLAYTNQYQLSQSPYSSIMFLADKHAGTALTFTANAEVSLYQSPKPNLNQTTFRDFATAFSAQQRLFRSPFLVNSLDESPVTASLAGSYQYFREYAGIKGKKADVGTATLKVEFPVAGAVSIPLSVTYATSPQDQALKSESYVHGDFGLTFDLDKLYTILHAPK
jgi:hypothetical protein